MERIPASQNITVRSLNNNSALWKKIKSMNAFYIMLLLPSAFLIVFNYLPMYGVIIAFKDFRFADGLLGSPWNNFHHFKLIFDDVFFERVFWNTLRISLLRILVIFPAPIIFALLINEIIAGKFKKVVQTVSYLPNFISWVVIGTFVRFILSPENGAVNYILALYGIKSIYFLLEPNMFIPVLLISLIWASVGWNSIIYLAAIASIDVQLYESAYLDGATRLQKAIYITLPSIVPTITVLLILSFGSIMKAGFDPIFNLYNPAVYSVADVIDTYVYRIGLVGTIQDRPRYDYAAAIGLFQNVIGLTLLIVTNKIVKRFNEYGIW
ncbi:MAG: sugar ABC transporter permease [Ruminiclostridium sp.]|nr:sugar ABC transporter permease [Ruminiclostridium sp.]